LSPSTPNSPSLALATDLYQLTMAQAYWSSGLRERIAAFHLFFRSEPFQGGFTVACGLGYVIDFLRNFHFTDEDTAYLATLTGNDDKPIFNRDFLDYLRHLEFSCDIDAVPEGAIVFPHEPLARVTGPIIQAQILETALINMVGFQTLIATKAARVCLAARGDPVIEFGLRRAQGFDGALAASRAAYIGGCAATSNVLAGKRFGIPVKGTHAHSWVMSFDDETEAFRAFAKAVPNDCVFLVDTYDTLEGVRRAVDAGKWLRKNGHKMIGIRLDSGDLAYLSIEARKILDEGGFPDAIIMASNDLDEHIIASLKEQGAKIAVWGVGTRLVTAFDQPALGCVYKLSAVRDGGPWKRRIKLSEQAVKVSDPGLLQVRRFSLKGEYSADVIYDIDLGVPSPCVAVDPLDQTRRKTISEGMPHEDLLTPVFRAGRLASEPPSIEDARRRCHEQLDRFHFGVKRFVNPHRYPVGLEKRLYDLKTELVLKARGLK
jgi:nicotinate phosphoribosyltransferase